MTIKYQSLLPSFKKNKKSINDINFGIKQSINTFVFEE